MFPEPKKKKNWAKKAKKKGSKKKTGGEAWRGYNSVKKENIATPLDESPTAEEEQSLADKA
jgi:hypothetical protein